MSDERERCLELLGLKPGASAQEIKAAYRDLAKVWHPDRFAHDARLQEKAQNKLKEINEAYEALTTGNFNRGRSTPRSSNDSQTTQAQSPSSSHTGGKYVWTTLTLIACLVTTAFFIAPRLLPEEKSEAEQMSASSSSSSTRVAGAEAEKDEALSGRQEKKSVEKQKAPAAASIPAPVEAGARVRAIPTVTVTIDPTTGAVATAACPIKSSMTYVSGQEPRQPCSADHQASAATKEASAEDKKKSRLKSVVNRLAAPARWLKDKTQ
jgi:curved DNA-binding protein CbpA